MTSKPILIVTRGSALALAQSHMTLAQCRRGCAGESFDLKIIKTTGDKLQTASLAGANLPKGLFTKELEVALLDGEGDLAVHSLKDLPTDLPDGLALGAVSRREDVRDVLIYRETPFPAGGRHFAAGMTVKQLPHGARVATSSTRRRAQLLEVRPDLEVSEIRGNVGTRLRKLAEQAELDAIILAAAGLLRLEMRDRIRAFLSPEQSLPAGGQGAVGIECRMADVDTIELLKPLHHAATAEEVTAERAMNRRLEGGCEVPIACYAVHVEEGLWLRGLVAEPDGCRILADEIRGPVDEAESMGIALAERLLAAGADEILAAVAKGTSD